MNPIKWFIPIACISTSLLAQTANDLNGLVAAAAHYVSSGMAGTHDTENLVLSKITGNNGSLAPTYLMTKATDVQHWTFQYQVNGPRPEEAVADPKPKPHLSAQAECTQGIFNNFHFSDQSVKGVKSLEFTWVAVSLDNAIANLNANGFVRGFSSVELMRPDLANWPDDYVYVFNCPWERQKVGVSCQTGAVAWTYSY